MYALVYNPVVKSRIHALFGAVNAGNPRPVYAAFADRFEHYFVGAHALGGARHSQEALRAWYERLYRLLPDIHFEIEDIMVSGPPWNTLAFVRWRESNSGQDGVRVEAEGAHIVRLAWGKMTFLGIYPDVAALTGTLNRMGAKGIEEALAAPIEDWGLDRS